MRMGNPAVRRVVNRTQGGELLSESDRATYKGVYLKTALYVGLTIIAALAAEFLINIAIKDGRLAEALTAMVIAAVVSAIPLIILSLVIMFVPKTAMILGSIYALLQGAFLGIITAIVDYFYPGIALSAFLGTAVVLMFSMIGHYVLKARIKGGFVRGLVIATVSFTVLQLVMFVISLTGIFNYTAYLWIQLAISALCVIWATVMLFWDFRNIDAVVRTGTDKKYEWYVAFSLATTIIYLYIEILELILRIAMILGSNRK